MIEAAKRPDTTPLDAAALRADFPLLSREVNGYPLVYLDSAATAQKPQAVLDAVDTYYRLHNANVHRGVHTLGGEATDLFEGGRRRVADFIDADSQGVVFVRNATEGLNLVAYSYARELLAPGDRIVVTEMEHHSNLVPWQLAAQRGGLTLDAIRLHPDGGIDMDHAAQLLTAPTKLFAFSHQSNVLGTINDAVALTRMAHDAGAVVVLDAAQSIPHMPVSVRHIDADFVAFSGHKLGAPMGIGVLWGRPELLDAMPPFLGGGSMIAKVKISGTTWNEVPHKFEAGTPDVASVVGLTAACDYIDAVGRDAIHAHEQLLTQHTVAVLRNAGAEVYGPADMTQRGGAVSFNMPGVHAHDVGTILDSRGVAIRAGHHCCQPLMDHLGVAATARASVYLYNTPADIDALGTALAEVTRIFG